MTENNGWLPPGGSAAGQSPTPATPPVPPQPPAGGYTPFASPASTGPATGPGYNPPIGSATGGGWTPPPKPGLIPLRPLGFGTLLGASFQVIRRNPRPTFGIALLLNGLVTVLFVGVIGGVAALAFGRLSNASQQNTDDIAAGSVAAVALASLIPIALSVLVGAVLQGIISLEVSRGTIGEKLTVRGLWRLAKGRIGALIGWSALVTGAVLVIVVLLATAIGLLVAFGGSAGVAIAVLIGICAGLGAAVLWFWIATKLSLIPSVLMLERTTLREAVARSWSLTRGYFWKTLGTQLLVNVIVQTAAQIVTFPVSLVLGFGAALLDPNGDAAAGVAFLVIIYIVTGIISLVFAALASVTASSVTALIYIDIRMRKEGLDLELTRFVEARQVGDVGVGNPYLPHDGPAASTVYGPPSAYGPPSTPLPPSTESPWA
ncbi:hypothetical protein HD599_002513 [Conyzicola lurida]|uniref:Glycerophosphoryl diester phosphodiesterase membrane domain-containing protein n=1 Tax=Conyzicola lurida TaxID=1172621 RepID=A0A841AJV2_9MICO|nr:glycerophosphoryl diester phosphodiesterase membrane domain-containing protein [Conyzicola lurida]MBB5844190.1 hypothetical protein [Conyzicola lurida]